MPIFRPILIRRRRVAALIWVLLPLLCGLGGLRLLARAEEAHLGSTGSYNGGGPTWEVATMEFSLHDDAQGRDIELKAYYPEADSAEAGAQSRARYPIIIFSHGAGGSREVAPALLSYWAAHGYVIVAPTHQDSVQLRRRNGDETSMQAILRDFGTKPELRLSRIADCKFILDRLEDIEYELPDLDGRIDREHIGMSGHSAGAMAAAALAGTIADMPVNGPGGLEAQDLSEPRADAFLVLSGQGMNATAGLIGRGALNEQSWAGIGKPMMVMTGSLDGSSRTGQTPESRCDPYKYAPPGDKYLLFIEGAAHMSFTGKAAGKEGPGRGNFIARTLGVDNADLTAIDQYDQQAIFECVQASSLAFWDAFLKDDTKAKQYLASDSIEKLGNPEVEYSRK